MTDAMDDYGTKGPDNGTTTSDFKTSDEIKPDGMVTKVGGRKLDSWAGKSPMRKGK